MSFTAEMKTEIRNRVSSMAQETPDVFSFRSGVFDLWKEYMKSTDSSEEVQDYILEVEGEFLKEHYPSA